MTKMAILFDVDKCMRCNGCVLGCKRTWNMKNTSIGQHTVSADQRVTIKSQKKVDMGPFIRFSCWHCQDPPCMKNCPKNAIAKESNGAVSVDPALCDPTVCGVNGFYPCQRDCQNGGYPKIGDGSHKFATDKSWKCTLCHGRAGADGDLDDYYGAPLPTRASAAEVSALSDRKHEPTCVYTCPAKALEWNTQESIVAKLTNEANGYTDITGDPGGSVFWASKKSYFATPKADPLIEDHISPMVGSLLSGPFAKAAIVPTLIAGGLLALSARRNRLERDASMTLEEV